MKFLIPLSLLVLSSCGKVNIISDGNLNALISTQKKDFTSGSEEFKNLKDICDSLQIKSNYVSSLVGSTYTMGNQFKTCDQTALSSQADSVVTVVNQMGKYKFNVGFSSYFFPDVETHDDGIMEKVCTAISNSPAGISLPISMNPNIAVGDALVMYSTQNISSSDCVAASNETCVKVESAVAEMVTEDKKSVLRGRVHTRDWLKFRTSNLQGLEGFYVYRKRLSTAGCIDKTFTIRTATLK